MRIEQMSRLLGALLLVLLVSGGGWTNVKPADVINVSSNKRNNVFYLGESIAFAADKPVTSYLVRNYFGEIVDKGKDLHALKSQLPGWYKLYVFTDPGEAVAGTTFCVFRPDSRFPCLPAQDVGSNMVIDEVIRGVCGIGPQRHRALADLKSTYQELDSDTRLDQQFYLPFDPVRNRSLLIAFPQGTADLTRVSEIVRKYAALVKNWEPRNEPNFGSTGANFAIKEMKPFYQTVKAIDPSLHVLGPGTVSIGPGMLPWLEDFFKAGGGKYIDAFSFHAYNNVSGDLALGRKSMDSLQELLKQYGLENIEKWQTEQGIPCALYGVFEPRFQGRWTMLQMMLFEQYGIPKEHNHLWYDKSHGFWDAPNWWENGDGSLDPAAALLRVWSQELYGKKYMQAYDFGEPGNQMYLGDLFSGPDGSVAAIMSSGSTDGYVDVEVTGDDTLKLTDAFGNSKSLKLSQGHARLSVTELPLYVELKQGQWLTVLKTDWGKNLALQPGVKVTATGTAKDANEKKLGHLINGEMESFYWNQQWSEAPLKIEQPQFPYTIQLDLAQPETVARAVVFATPSWQFQGSLLDYDVQCLIGDRWKTVAHAQEPTRVIKASTPMVRTSVDSFYSDRWVFENSFKPVQTSAIRLVIKDSTWGGCPNKLAFDAGGQGWPQNIVLREIELYAR